MTKLRGVARHVAHSSGKGCQAIEMLNLYLHWIRGDPRCALTGRIVLLLDAYSVHRYSHEKEIAGSPSACFCGLRRRPAAL